MEDEEKTREQLFGELEEMRRVVSRCKDLEKEFKETVEDLRESEQRYRLLLESSPEPTVTYDTKGRVTYLNPPFTKTFGWSSDEVLGRSIPYVPEEYLPGTQESFERLVKGERVPSFDTKRRTKDGRILDIHVSCWPFRNKQGDPAGYVVTLRDITERKRSEESARTAHGELEKRVKERTAELLRNNRRLTSEIAERKRAEAALRQSQEKYKRLYEESMRGQELYRSLLNSTPDAIVIYDVKGRVLYVNDSFSQTFGWELSEILGKRIDYVPESERETTMAAIDLVMRKGIPRSGLETKRYTKDGRILDTRLSGSRYHDHEGNPAGMLVIIRDITSRKRSEERLRASLREKEVLLREIFHRVKNNLQVISSLLRLQSRYVPREEYRQLFIDSQNRLQSMAFIHEKLYQSKDLANIDFRGYINGLAAHLFHSLGTSPSLIAFTSDIEAVSMGIDTAIPCGLIANELISNSLIHAFPNNRKGRIGITLATCEQQAFELVVWDDGVGLPEGLDLQSAESLGLHLVYTLVEQLEGEITLDRSQGTEFRVRFEECRSKGMATE